MFFGVRDGIVQTEYDREGSGWGRIVREREEERKGEIMSTFKPLATQTMTCGLVAMASSPDLQDLNLFSEEPLVIQYP